MLLRWLRKGRRTTKSDSGKKYSDRQTFFASGALDILIAGVIGSMQGFIMSERKLLLMFHLKKGGTMSSPQEVLSINCHLNLSSV